MHICNSCFNKLSGIFGGSSEGWLYARFIIMSIVLSMGTFVNSDSTSSEAILWVKLFDCSRSIKSLLDLRQYLDGIYGDIILFKVLASCYVGDVTCEIMGLKGLPGLWILTVP